MARPYGGRWQLVDAPPLGQGGQSHVFRATDVTGVLPGEFALKRVLNPKRVHRFSAEIEAITRLQHPNIVKLIDHSALTDGQSQDERQFLVMPIAHGGDLSDSNRLGLYSSAIDSVLKIGIQIASALSAAHADSIIHRDIKPQNILFTGNGHELWVADFGICLISDRPRGTETGEVVGPRAFMAPELEDGGKLDATSAADVYSLGKVLYYALSGGVTLPRERMHEAQYAKVFAKGERYGLLEQLLRQMVCDLGQRLKTMDEVLSRLRTIEDWEQMASLGPISHTGRAAIEQLQRNFTEGKRIAMERAAEVDRRDAILAAILEGFKTWLHTELTKAAAQIGASTTFDCTVGSITTEAREVWRATVTRSKHYVDQVGLELRIDREESGLIRRDILQIRLCKPLVVTVQVALQGVAASPPVSNVYTEFAMIPYYKRVNLTKGKPPGGVVAGYLAKPTLIGQRRTRVRLQRGPQAIGRNNMIGSYTVAPVTVSFNADVNQITIFQESEWPVAADTLRDQLVIAIDSFLQFLASAGGVGE